MSTDQTWRERMSRADFDGFEFLTDAHDAKGGRRLVVHEYPGADEPDVEDLGGKAWDWKLNAYFIGENYDLEKNGFLARLAKPGAVWLRHPWMGYLWVRAHNWFIHESTDKGGFCTIAVDFVPGGEQPLIVEPDRVDVAFDRTRKYADYVVDDFAPEPMSADGMTAFVAAVHQKLEVLRTAISMASLPLTWANQVMTLIAGVKNDLKALMAIPSDYAAALRGLTDALGGGADSSDLSDTDRPRMVSRILRSTSTQTSGVLTGVAATDGAVRRNLLQEDALRSRLLVASAAEVAIADYRAESDRDAALSSIVSAIDALLPEMTDDVFQAAVTARAAIIDALLAQDLKATVVRDITAPLPAVVLAWRLGIDEDVFLARNAVRHPLFVMGRVYG